MKISRKVRNKTRVLVWTTAWGVSTFLTSYGSDHLWPNNDSLNILMVVITFSLGIGMILSNRKWLMTCDELQQKIQLESMALALGLSIIVGLSYSMLYKLNLIGQEAEIAHLIMFLGITYLVSIVINKFRYA